MTSGQFALIPPDSIFVNRERRQRRELKGIDELADSIRRIGLIHPPVIERTGELRAGERRWTAIKQLGWTTMPVQYTDEVEESELQLLELEENIKRENIEWADECRGVAAYHSLCLSRDTSWTVTQTAEAIGMSQPTVSQKLDVAKELAKGNARLEAAPKYSVARNIVQRVKERAASSDTAKIAEIMGAPKLVAPILNEDFNEWAAAYTGQKFNVIHCDFPYGINAQNTQQGSEVIEKGSYDDSPDVYWQLLKTLEMGMSNVVADSAHLIFWFSMDYYAETLARLSSMSWKVNPFPLVWFKSDNTGILPDAQRGPRRVYETAFFASRGDRKLTANGAVANAFAHPGADKEIHMSEKPVPMLRHFMRMVCDEYSRVLDPTAGSANALKAASALGAGSVLGLERDETFFNNAVAAYFNQGVLDANL